VDTSYPVSAAFFQKVQDLAKAGRRIDAHVDGLNILDHQAEQSDVAENFVGEASLCQAERFEQIIDKVVEDTHAGERRPEE